MNMRAIGTCLLAVFSLTLPQSVFAQVAERLADQQPPTAAEPADTAKATSPFIVNDNIFGYYYVPDATNPGAGKTPKNVLVFNHFDVWKYGTNFVSVEFLKATNGRNPPFGTPKEPCDQGGPLYPPGEEQCSGYSEVYGFVRSTLGWNQVFDTKRFAVGPLTNIEFAAGFDLNWDNTTLASRKRSIQAGLQFDFSAPHKGFLNVGAYVYKEWQNDGFAATFPVQPNPNPSGDVDFDPTWAIELNYSQPIGTSPFKYKSLLVLHGPKGCGEPCQPLGPGLLRTTEVLTQQLLVFDASRVFWNEPGRFAIFAGYRYWDNKFGIEEDQPNGPFIGTTESTWLAGAAVKF